MCLYSPAPILPIAPGPEQAFRTLFGCCPPPTTVNQTKRTDNRIRGLDAARDEKVEMADRRAFWKLHGNGSAGASFQKAYISFLNGFGTYFGANRIEGEVCILLLQALGGKFCILLCDGCVEGPLWESRAVP
jgi:hypothetical protein